MDLEILKEERGWQFLMSHIEAVVVEVVRDQYDIVYWHLINS